MKNAKKYLLVEGNGDKHVILALRGKHNIPQTFEIIDCEGINNLVEQIPIRFKESGIDTVGLIVDADIDLSVRWQSIKERLIKAGFPIPHNLPETGLIVKSETQKAGVWIMPDNKDNGMLEDFLSFLVPEDDMLLPIVDSTLKEIESRKLNKYSTIHKSKARIHSWLAWQEDPGTPLGLSITKRYLTTDKVTCRNLINWLIELFKD